MPGGSLKILCVCFCFQIALCQFEFTDNDEICITVDGGNGTCVSVVTCTWYETLLKQPATKYITIQKLKDAHCGFEGNNPKVCCPFSASFKAPSGKPIPTSDFIDAFPEPPVCGLFNATLSKVIDGIDAKPGEFPWMALVGYKVRGSRSWLCGGSLISHHHVLTAAHCIHKYNADLYVVRLGELDYERDDESATPLDILIKNKIIHEEYYETAPNNDIGLLVLERDVDFTDLGSPICIPTRSDMLANNFVDYNPLVGGWGYTGLDGSRSSHLQVVQLPVLDNSYCSKAYEQVIDEHVMCVGFKTGGKDACKGDSGGPLMQPDNDQVKLTSYYYQTGLVSYGRTCAEAGGPGVYTRITYFVPWLEEQVLDSLNEHLQF